MKDTSVSRNFDHHSLLDNELLNLFELDRSLQDVGKPVNLTEVCNLETFNEELCTNEINKIVDITVREEFKDFIQKESSDAIWLVIAGILVFFLHAGFSMLESGSVRKPNMVNIMFKNVGTVAVGAIVYWAFGFAFAYGSDDNRFIGSSQFFFDFDSEDNKREAFFFFEYTLSATAASVISGAVAERINLEAYFLIVFWVTGFVLPVVTHWVWSDTGLMSAYAVDQEQIISGSIGFIDFGGGGVVHTVGGVVAFIGAWIIGPRYGRFVMPEENFKPSSHSLQTLGTTFLLFGWFGVNPGSTLEFEGVNTVKAAVTTVLSSSAAGVFAILYSKFVSGSYDLPLLLNCMLAGLVSITPGCVAVSDGNAIWIGFFGALFYVGSTKLLIRMKIDDPLEASVVHGVSSIWGAIAVGIFTNNDAIRDAYGVIPTTQGAQFMMQVVGILLIILWSALWGLAMFVPLKIFGILRVPESWEKQGLDKAEMGGEVVHNF